MSEDLDLDEIALRLRVALGLLRRHLELIQVDEELSLPETSALVRLEGSGPITSAALARLERISPQSMGATLGALEARGLVERSADPNDGRQSFVSVTKNGRHALRARRDAKVRAVAKALADSFTSREQKQLAAAAPLFERLARALTDAHPGHDARR